MTVEQIACLVVLLCVVVPMLLIAWEEHQNDALRKEREKRVWKRADEPPPPNSRLVALKCTACGAEVPCTTPGQVAYLTEQHQKRCPKRTES